MSANPSPIRLHRLRHAQACRLLNLELMRFYSAMALVGIAALTSDLACSAPTAPEAPEFNLNSGTGATGGTGAKSPPKAGQTPSDTSATTCALTVETSKPTVVHELASIRLAFIAATNGSTCSLEVGTRRRSIPCGAPLALNGADFGVGIHEATLRVAAGPTGAAECRKKFRVVAPLPCHVSWEATGEHTENDFKYDDRGRRISEVVTWTRPAAYGQQIWSLTYEGNTGKTATEIRTFAGFQGVPNTRKDSFKNVYEAGSPDELGEVFDRVKSRDFDDNSDGKIEMRQIFNYEKSGRLLTVDEDRDADGTINARYTHEYDERGRIKSRTFDAELDGKIDATASWVFDAQNVLKVHSSTGSQVFSWTPQYVCH
jgi:hypothetical protein